MPLISAIRLLESVVVIEFDSQVFGNIHDCADVQRMTNGSRTGIHPSDPFGHPKALEYPSPPIGYDEGIAEPTEYDEYIVHLVKPLIDQVDKFRCENEPALGILGDNDIATHGTVDFDVGHGCNNISDEIICNSFIQIFG